MFVLLAARDDLPSPGVLEGEGCAGGGGTGSAGGWQGPGALLAAVCWGGWRIRMGRVRPEGVRKAENRVFSEPAQARCHLALHDQVSAGPGGVRHRVGACGARTPSRRGMPASPTPPPRCQGWQRRCPGDRVMTNWPNPVAWQCWSRGSARCPDLEEILLAVSQGFSLTPVVTKSRAYPAIPCWHRLPLGAGNRSLYPRLILPSEICAVPSPAVRASSGKTER